MGTVDPEPPPLRIPLPKPVVPGGPTLRQEWLLIAVVGVLISACLTIDAFAFRQDLGEGRRTPLTWVAAILCALGQGVWMTMDRNRRGLGIGYWRFGAIFLGPVVIAIYLILEYRLRALYLIPLAATVYIGVGVAPLLVLLVAEPFRR